MIIGELFEALEDVTATDQEDGDITAALEVVKNEVDNTAAGIYKVVYRVTDSAGCSFLTGTAHQTVFIYCDLTMRM